MFLFRFFLFFRIHFTESNFEKKVHIEYNRLSIEMKQGGRRKRRIVKYLKQISSNIHVNRMKTWNLFENERNTIWPIIFRTIGTFIDGIVSVFAQKIIVILFDYRLTWMAFSLTDNNNKKLCVFVCWFSIEYLMPFRTFAHKICGIIAQTNKQTKNFVYP